MKNLDLCIRLLTDLYCRDAPVIHGAIAALTKRPAHNIENTLSLSRGIAQYFEFKEQKGCHSGFNEIES